MAIDSPDATASDGDDYPRCQTTIVAEARHLRVIRPDLAVALSVGVSRKSIFFDW